MDGAMQKMPIFVHARLRRQSDGANPSSMDQVFREKPGFVVCGSLMEEEPCCANQFLPGRKTRFQKQAKPGF
jgi:hypothetical protein